MKTNTTNIPAGYKNSPLGIIPIDWEVKRLGEIGVLSSGMTPLRSVSKFYDNGEVNWVKTTDLNNSILYKTEEKVSEIAIKETSLKIHPKGSILIAMYGGFNQIGRTSILGVDAAINQALSCLTFSDDRYCGYYVLSFLNLFVDKWKQFAASSRKDPNITSQDVNDFLISLPPLSEQRRIAEILTTWDEAIEKQSQKIKQLEQRKKGLMQQLLTGKKRLNGFTDKWKTVKLGEVFMERNEMNRGDLPLLSIGQDGVYPQSESAKKDTSNEDKSKYKRICPNDIGYNTMRMWQGRSALSALEGIVSPAYTIVTPNSEQNPIFISELIKLPHIVNDFWRHSQGLVSDTLNCKFPDFSQVKVTIPSSKEQTAIAAILTTADEEIQNEKQKLENLKSQKKGLMQVLLTGKVRVK
ncbi:MAG: restriction endonuclease subunit S [Bacteroidales bacterium]|nr:restriction endonuclease subunit S [Bacteroidales bacterium]